MAIIAFFHGCGRRTRVANFTCHRSIFRIVNRRAITRDHNPVAFFEIADFLRERRKRQRVGTDVGLVYAIPNDERGSSTGTNQNIWIIAECYRERKGSTQTG